jgi:hypothetical protein
VTVSGCSLTGNSATGALIDEGGAIYHGGTGTVAVSTSNFSANTPDAIFGAWTDGGGNMFS